MNVLNLLSKEIEDKNWNIEEKIRYLYIRSCQLFSYDERFKFLNLDLYEDLDIDEIKYRKIDLENVIDTRVICTSHAQQVVSKIIKELLNVDCKALGTSHLWTRIYDGERFISADATKFNDLARVKMSLTTDGYKPTTREFSYEERLRQIDKKIGYIKENYANEILKEYTNKFMVEHSNNSDEFIINGLNIIKELFEEYKTLQSFSDNDYCISYLILKIFGNKYLNPVSLFDVSLTGDWSFVNLYPFQLENERIYFVLEKIKKEFCFYEIPQSEALKYVKSLNGINKEIIMNY